MPELTLIQKICIWVLPILFAITVHEFAHGWVAHLCGDATAKRLGRLTLNPIRHIDPIGTVILPITLMMLGGVVFGWAKPVPVTYENLRRPRRDMALVAIAGPLSNLLMALLWALVARFGGYLDIALDIDPAVLLVYMGHAGILMNLFLMVLNLLPIPPLDGSKVLMALLPGPLAYQLSRLEPYGMLILLALLMLNILSIILVPLAFGLYALIVILFGLA